MVVKLINNALNMRLVRRFYYARMYALNTNPIVDTTT